MTIKRSVNILFLLSLAAAGLAGPAWAASRSTNVTVDTREAGLISLNEKDQKPADELLEFYKDDESGVGFNDSGESGYARHF